MTVSLKQLFQQAVVNADIGAKEFGTLGWHVPGEATLIFVKGQKDRVWVTRRDQTVIEATVKGVIEYTVDFPVEYREERGGYVVLGKSVHPSLPAVDLSSTLRLVGVPATATASGAFGDFAVASGFLYVCVATDTWERVALATW